MQDIMNNTGMFIRLGKSPGSLQQSAVDGKVDGQLSMPHIKLPLQSLSESQSPSFNPHWLDDEQQFMTSLSLPIPMQPNH